MNIPGLEDKRNRSRKNPKQTQKKSDDTAQRDSRLAKNETSLFQLGCQQEESQIEVARRDQRSNFKDVFDDRPGWPSFKIRSKVLILCAQPTLAI